MISQGTIREIEVKILPKKKLLTFFEKRNTFPIQGNITNYKELLTHYKYVSKGLNIKFRMEIVRTIPELRVYKFLKAITGMEVLHSVWIGNHCVDIFIPSLGLIIEIDGSYHLREEKMRKDTLRDKNMSAIGLDVMPIENRDIERVPMKFVLAFQQLKRKSTYKKRKMMRDIALLTCIANQASQESSWKVQK